MNNKRVMIIDYGIGNIYSVQRAVEVCGGKNVIVSSNPADVYSADRLILPGVGAFKDGMNGLNERGLTNAILDFAKSGKPLLGICLGMQMLATTSEEFGVHAGLNLIPGTAKVIPRAAIDQSTLKVPFIGWSPLIIESAFEDNNSCLRGLNGQSVYLVHSYSVILKNPLHLLAHYEYGGHHIAAAFKKDNITGLQFHPEKSGEVGLRILKNFMSL